MVRGHSRWVVVGRYSRWVVVGGHSWHCGSVSSAVVAETWVRGYVRDWVGWSVVGGGDSWGMVGSKSSWSGGNYWSGVEWGKRLAADLGGKSQSSNSGDDL